MKLASIRDKSGYFGPVPAVGLEPKQNLGMKINSVKIPLKRLGRLFHETASTNYMQVNFLRVMKFDDGKKK